MVGWASSWAVLVMAWAERWAAARPLVGLRRPGKSFFLFPISISCFEFCCEFIFELFYVLQVLLISFIQELVQGTTNS
jgi:hypothetical protein